MKILPAYNNPRTIKIVNPVNWRSLYSANFTHNSFTSGNYTIPMSQVTFEYFTKFSNTSTGWGTYFLIFCPGSPSLSVGFNFTYTSLYYVQYNGTGNTTTLIGSANPINSNTKYHIAFTFTTTEVKAYVNGVLKCTFNPSTLPGGAADLATNNLKNFILQVSGNAAYRHYLRHARLSNNVRYTGAFTPPDVNDPLTADANTILLWPFQDETSDPIDTVSGVQLIKSGTTVYSDWGLP